jgi:hypothetical protein
MRLRLYLSDGSSLFLPAEAPVERVIETADHWRQGFVGVTDAPALFVKGAIMRADSLFAGDMLFREGGYIATVERREELSQRC